MRNSKSFSRKFRPLIDSICSKPGPQGFLAGLFGEAWRPAQQRKTLQCLASPEFRKNLRDNAHNNLERWSEHARQQPRMSPRVEVVPNDYGSAALLATRASGDSYVITNFANATYPGGGWNLGGSAQEENLMICSDVLEWIADQIGGGVIYNKNRNEFTYELCLRELISGQTSMTPEELSKLSKLKNMPIESANKAFFSPQQHYYFRGPEVYIQVPSGESMSGGFELSQADSLEFLPDELVFPFKEARIAAHDLTDGLLTTASGDVICEVDWDSESFRQVYRQETKQRIDALLDTLILNGERNVVIGALGCGAFMNPADSVAALFKQSIEERSEHFSHIVFPIYTPRHGKNHTNAYTEFEKQLHGLPLLAEEHGRVTEISPQKKTPRV